MHYLWVEGYPEPKASRVQSNRAADDLEVELDDTDILRGRLFIFKGYLPGRAYRIHYSHWLLWLRPTSAENPAEPHYR